MSSKRFFKSYIYKRIRYHQNKYLNCENCNNVGDIPTDHFEQM